MATQTQTQRKAAAQKAAATRRRNAAKRSRSAKRATRTRAQAQGNALQAVGLQAQRVADTAIGATVVAGENIGNAVKPLTDPRRELQRRRREWRTGLRRAERRGAQARKRALRGLRRTERDVEQRVDGARREAEQAIGGLI